MGLAVTFASTTVTVFAEETYADHTSPASMPPEGEATAVSVVTAHVTVIVNVPTAPAEIDP
jgi:hypothetical protein